MSLRDFKTKLRASDDFAQYSLRATFFARTLRGMRLFETIQEIHEITKLKKGFPWKNPQDLGIEPDAWRRIEGASINPLLIFCHPRVIAEQPRLLLYYRTLALISQKGLGKLISGNLAAIEGGKVERLDAEWVGEVTFALNSILSAIVLTAAEIDAKRFPGYQFATAGTTIQGSWNNAIGSEGEKAVKTILVNNLSDEIEQIGWRTGGAVAYSADLHPSLIDRLDDVRVIRLKEGFHLLFASEPDISLRNPGDVPQVAIEVKAGADPAGALERLGAAMKSFENDRALNPRVKTVYVVRCITPELDSRIREMHPFDYTFGLAELLTNERTQKRFASLLIRHVLKKA